MEKTRLLFLLQVPPPVHGAALRNKSLLESELLNNTFQIKLQPIKFAESIADIGRVSLSKLFKVITFSLALLVNLIFYCPKAVYFTIAPVGGAFIRDALFVTLLKLFMVKRIYHVRGLGIREQSNSGWKKHLYHYVFKKSYVIILNNNQKNDIERLPYKRMFIVPNGMKDESVLAGGMPKKTTLSLLYLSNYVKDKGALLFLDILYTLRSQGYKVTGMMAGADADVTKTQLESIAQDMGIEDSINIYGPIYDQEKFELYHKADIFVFPSFIDLNPGVVIEAMQCSLPVVSTPIGGIPELVDDGITGDIVKEINCNSFVDKISTLIDDPKTRIEYGKRGRKKYLSHYNQEAFEQNMQNTFTDILDD